MRRLRRIGWSGYISDEGHHELVLHLGLVIQAMQALV
jgi:hypothetical protein